MVIRKVVVWTWPARNDLQAIYNYLAEISITIAGKQIEIIIRKIDILETGYSRIGQVEPLLKNRAREYRYLVQDTYKIIYFLEEEKIVVSMVFDTRQNPRKLKQ